MDWLEEIAKFYGVAVNELVKLFHVGGGEGGFKWFTSNPGTVPAAMRSGFSMMLQ